MGVRITVLLLFASALHAATLKPESVAAWDSYLESAESNLQKRAQESATFLWIDESRERRDQVRSGEIAVAEVHFNGRKKAPSAMIHHWIGASFIPGARIADVVSIVRSYDSYKQYYPPTVVRSATTKRGELNDRFSILLMNQAVLVRTAVEADCQATFTQVDGNRWYGKTISTRLQEIEDFGHARERRIPVGEGGGFLWRMASFTRFEERDGGVYFELEVMALSRDVPISLRLVVDPIIRRVSRNSVTESMLQTAKAVSHRVAVNAQATQAAVQRSQPAPRNRRATILGMAITNP